MTPVRFEPAAARSLGSNTLPLTHCDPMSCELTKKCKNIASSELSLTADWQSRTPNFGAGTLIFEGGLIL